MLSPKLANILRKWQALETRLHLSGLIPLKNCLPSPADKWNNYAFDDKRMKLGTHVKHIQLSIFSYRAILDWSRDPYGRSL